MVSNLSPRPGKEAGLVKEALPGLAFTVTIEGNRDILAYLAGKLKINRIRIVPGDKVLVEIGPDGRRGRIVRRL